MNTEQALHIVEQAIQLGIKGCAKLEDMKAIMIAWDIVRPLIKLPEADAPKTEAE